jgi:hypothetical protein
MTYGEIYDEICQHCFPGVTPPINMPPIIRQKIKSAHRMLNRDYPFWFSLTTNTITTIAGTQTYLLPTDYREMEKAFFTIYLQTYGGSCLTQLDITDHLDRGLQYSSSQTEYPTQFRIDGTYLYLYPIPSEVRTLNLLYWKFLTPLNITVATLATNFTPFTDDISEFCAECIIYYVASVVKLMQDEWQSSASYKQLFIESLEGAMHEDKIRRSIPEIVAPWTGASDDGMAL